MWRIRGHASLIEFMKASANAWIRKSAWIDGFKPDTYDNCARLVNLFTAMVIAGSWTCHREFHTIQSF